MSVFRRLSSRRRATTSAGTLTIEIRVVDNASPVLRRLAWRVRFLDGSWHREFMVAAGLPDREATR